MSTPGERIRTVRERLGISREELAAYVGRKYSTIADLENGKSNGSTVMDKIAERLGVRADYLRSGKGPETASLTADEEGDWSDIKGYAQAVGLGNSVEGDEYAEAHKLKFRRESLARKRLNPRSLAVVYGKGDSMLPRIHDGDAILFDQSDTRPVDGALYVIEMQGAANHEYNVKRCKIVDDLVLFEADNPAGDHNWRQARRMDNPRNPIRIIGRVRWIGSWEG